MKIAICDDELIMRQTIQSHIENFKSTPTTFEFLHFNCGEKLLNYYSSGNKADIIFLDVEMNNLNGIETAAQIRSFQKDAIIIFVSAHQSYVFEAFRVEALHFLLKPIDEDEFNDVFCRALNKYKLLNSFMYFKWQNDRLKTPINDIIYIEGYRRHLTVHTVNEVFETVGKIPDLLKELEPHGFLRIHQGYLINMDYIRLFGKNDVLLTNGDKAMISVRKRNEALKIFDRYLQRKKW